jgi:hypothetical protein
VACDERERHILRTGNDQRVAARNQRRLALRGPMVGNPEVILKSFHEKASRVRHGA